MRSTRMLALTEKQTYGGKTHEVTIMACPIKDATYVAAIRNMALARIQMGNKGIGIRTYTQVEDWAYITTRCSWQWVGGMKFLKELVRGKK